MTESMTLSERFSKIVDVNGKEAQFEFVVEEASELIVAIQKMKRKKASIKKVIEEMADVLVTFGCLRELITRDYKESFDVNKLIYDIMKQKTNWAEECKCNEQASVPITWQDF